jgi:hypothetical protein
MKLHVFYWKKSNFLIFFSHRSGCGLIQSPFLAAVCSVLRPFWAFRFPSFLWKAAQTGPISRIRTSAGTKASRGGGWMAVRGASWKKNGVQRAKNEVFGGFWGFAGWILGVWVFFGGWLDAEW